MLIKQNSRNAFLTAFVSICVLASCRAEAASTPAQARAFKDRAFTEFFRRTSGWVAGDGAISVPLTNGRVLWLFGDSHVDDLDPRTDTMACLFQTRNAALLQDTNGVLPARSLFGHGTGFRSWFKNAADDNSWLWPLCGFQSGNTVYVYLFALHKTGSASMWDFASIGHDYWAKINFPGMDDITYVPLPGFNGIAFGMGFVNQGQYTYAFGGKQQGLASDAFVARFSSANPEGPWTFWDGRQWTMNVTNTTAIARAASTSIHVCKIKDKFLFLTSAFSMGCDQGKDIYASTSSQPTGPFSPLKKIFTIDDTFHGHYPFFYFPVAHPEFVNEKNELLVTYSINGYEPKISACVNGKAIPDHYRPRAIRVPLKLIDPNL